MSRALIDDARDLMTGDRNLSMTERAVSVVGGLALAAIGAQPRPNKWLSLLAVVVGSAIAIRGATGHCPIGPMLDDGAEPGSRDA